MASISEPPSSKNFGDHFNTVLPNVRNEAWDFPIVGGGSKATTGRKSENRQSFDQSGTYMKVRPDTYNDVPDTNKASIEEQEPRMVAGDSNKGVSHSHNASDGSNERLAAPRPAALQRQGSYNSADEGDSVLDFYGSRLSSTSGLNNEVYPNVNGSSTAMYDLSGDTDNMESSRWIHRDKLLRIESQENSSSTGKDDSRSGTRLGPTQRRETGQSSYSQPYYPENRTSNEQDDEADERETWDLRRPGERSAERTPMKTARRVASAGSYSRIPLSTTSPIPVPQEYIARTTPLRRRESNSPELGGDGTPLSIPRLRSKSVGSGANLDSDNMSTPTNAGKHGRNFSSQINSKNTASPSSPRRPSSANRPGSNVSHTKNRSRSQPGVGRNSTNTPTGSSASKHTAPQGPPPWSLSAYSPDPKLPPDQQLIPTVAKRLQQEQWERDGVYASVYDRKLRPLKVHEDEGDNPRTSGGDDEVNEWPLKRNTQGDDNLHHAALSISPQEETNQDTSQAEKVQSAKDLEANQMPPQKKKSKSCCGCSVM